MAGASILTLLAAASFPLIPVITKNAFGTLATTGVADPVTLAEDLPVRSNGVFMISLVAAQLLILVAAFTAPNSGTSTPSPAAGRPPACRQRYPGRDRRPAGAGQGG